MTKEEFIEYYCRNSKITREYYDRYYVALPCNCGEYMCQGWASIRNNPDIIEDHKRFYG